MSDETVSDDFDRADGDDLWPNAWTPRPGTWGIGSRRSGWTTLYAGQDGVTLDLPDSYPPYPRRDARPLRGWARLRFRWRLLSLGFVSVSTFQRTMVWKHHVEVLVDGLPGPQTWAAYWMLRRRLLG